MKKPSLQFVNTLSQIYHSESISFLPGLWRYFIWQGIKQFGHFPLALNISNSKLLVDRLSGIGTLIYCLNVYDFNNMNLLKHLLTFTNSVFFDVGANIGSYSLIASESPGAQIYSFEPHPVSFQSLVRNIEINSRDNVHAIQLALGEKEENSFLTDYPESSINRILATSESVNNGIRVTLRTLDQVCRDNKIHPGIIKIDVEGYELNVLKGFQEESKHTNAFLIENGQSIEIQNIMHRMGLVGPWYFHFRKRLFSHLPQARPEDPIYLREEYIKRLTEAKFIF